MIKYIKNKPTLYTLNELLDNPSAKCGIYSSIRTEMADMLLLRAESHPRPNIPIWFYQSGNIQAGPQSNCKERVWYFVGDATIAMSASS